MFQALDPRLANAPSFSVFREEKLLGKYKGQSGHDISGDYIDFIFCHDIVAGDKIIDTIGNEYIVQGIEQPKRIGGLSREQYFKVYYKTQSQPQIPLINNTITINNTNSVAVENNLEISITVQAVQNDIKNMDSLSDEETKLALEKVNELADILKSKENRKSKWSKVASFFKWIANKSVDLAVAFSPLIIQAFQNMH